MAARYAGSFGGILWTVVNPLLTCVLYGFVFSLVLRIPPPEGFAGSYLEFLLAGLIPWIGIQEALVRSASSVTEQANLVRKQGSSRSKTRLRDAASGRRWSSSPPSRGTCSQQCCG